MGLRCTFALNGRPVSMLRCPGLGDFPAFSGHGEGRNNPSATAKPGIGPAPAGRYYTVDRKSGGRLGALYDFLREYGYGTDRSEWFALYRDDGELDDATVIAGIRRGAFRLHPVGPRGLSEGCLTLMNRQDFGRLSAHLRAGPMIALPGGGRAYGTIEVR